jgi:sigma-B regulation protein RsbU (phosphoserine phosphatase)
LTTAAKRQPFPELSEFRLDELPTEEKRSLESDLRLAAQIQRTRVCRGREYFEGWHSHHFCQPAGLVGGDYCDLFGVGDRLFFLVADVSGKGLGACLMMSHLHATICALACCGLGLPEIMGAANIIFHRNFSPARFATLVIGSAERNGAVEFVNAGHLPFLHVCQAGPGLQAATALPLGLFPDARFPSQHLTLEHGQSLLICTDGVTEACDALNHEFGLRRLMRVAKQHHASGPLNLIEECLKDLRSFAGGKYTDDVTLLSIQRTHRRRDGRRR